MRMDGATDATVDEFLALVAGEIGDKGADMVRELA